MNLTIVIEWERVGDSYIFSLRSVIICLAGGFLAVALIPHFFSVIVLEDN